MEAYLRGEGSTRSHGEMLGISAQSLKVWVKKYEAQGVEGLLIKIKNQSYSAELKISAVEAYLSGEGSQCEVSRKFGISSKTQLQRWIKRYMIRCRTADNGVKDKETAIEHLYSGTIAGNALKVSR